MSEATPAPAAGAEAASSRRERRKTFAVAALYLCVLAADLWFFLLLPAGPWERKLGFLLQVLGIYAIGLGLLERVGILAVFKSSEEELTSPNLRNFVASNMMLSASVFLLASKAFRGVLYSTESYALLAVPVVFVAAPAVVLVNVAYLLAVVPIAYLAYLPVSIALVGLSHAGPERLSLARGKERYDLDTEVVKHLPALKSFLVGIPAFVVSFATAAWPLYF
jgi:hypothetical protein